MISLKSWISEAFVLDIVADKWRSLHNDLPDSSVLKSLESSLDGIEWPKQESFERKDVIFFLTLPRLSRVYAVARFPAEPHRYYFVLPGDNSLSPAVEEILWLINENVKENSAASIEQTIRSALRYIERNWPLKIPYEKQVYLPLPMNDGEYRQYKVFEDFEFDIDEPVRVSETPALRLFVLGNIEELKDYKALLYNKVIMRLLGQEFIILNPRIPYGISLDIASWFSDVLDEIPHIWEILIKGEPLVVFNESVGMVTRIALSLPLFVLPFHGSNPVYSLVMPGSSCQRFLQENYHFEENDKLSMGNAMVSGLIVGTSDYSLKPQFKRWPNKLFLGEISDLDSRKYFRSYRPKLKTRGYRMIKYDRRGLVKIRRGLKTKQLQKIGLDPRQISIKVADNPSQINRVKGIVNEYLRSVILINYLFSLTLRFIEPFNNYFVSLVPSTKDFKPFQPPTLKGFKEKEFIDELRLGLLGELKILRHSLDLDIFLDKHKSEKRKQVSDGVLGDKFIPIEVLYRRCIHTRNFRNWYAAKKHKSIKVFKKLYKEFESNFDPEQWVKGKTEVEVIDFVFRMIENIERKKVKLKGLTGDEHSELAETIETIRRKAEILLEPLPEPLKINMLTKLSRTALGEEGESVEPTKT